MSELPTSYQLAQYAAVIIVAMVILGWFESRRWRIARARWAGATARPVLRTGARMNVRSAPVLPVVLLTPAAWGQSHDPSANGWFRVSFEVDEHSVVPTIQGHVCNDSPLGVTDVGLWVEGLDADRHRVGQTFAWAFGDIAPGGDTSFVSETIPGAVTYLISVVSCNVVSVDDTSSPSRKWRSRATRIRPTEFPAQIKGESGFEQAS